MQQLSKDANSGQYVYGEAVSAGTSVAITMPNEVGVVTVALIISTGSGKVQYTVDGTTAVGDATATWIDWPHGTVSATKVDTIVGPITAVRAVWSSGTINFRVVG